MVLEEAIIIEEIERRIAEHENTAEELFQELDDPYRGDEELAKANALKSILEFIKEQ